MKKNEGSKMMHCELTHTHFLSWIKGRHVGGWLSHVRVCKHTNTHTHSGLVDNDSSVCASYFLPPYTHTHSSCWLLCPLLLLPSNLVKLDPPSSFLSLHKGLFLSQLSFPLPASPLMHQYLPAFVKTLYCQPELA